MSVLNCIFNYFKKHSHVFILTLFVIAAATALSLAPPQLLKIIVDDLNSGVKERLLDYAIFYMLLFIAIGLINFLKEVLLVILSQGVGKTIRIEMLNKIHKLSYITFSHLDTGNLEAYFSNDVEEINTLITSGVISMAIYAFKMIGIVVSIFIFSPIFGGITLLVIPIIVLFTMWIRKRMYKAQAANRALEGNVNNLVLENLDNVVTIKSFRIYENVEEKYNEVLKNHFKTNQKANTYDAVFSPIMQILKMILIVLIICLSSADISLFGMSVGMLVSSIDLITNLFNPIESLGMELQTIQKSMAAIFRINEYFNLPEDEKKKHYDINLDSIKLEFKDVSFSYDGQNNVIENFNLVLNGSDRLVLKGKSGSGKTTLFKLAYGLIKPTKGAVTINGIPTYLMSDELKRQVFGIVYQDYFFSGGSIKDEITLCNDISDDAVYKVLHQVGLDRINDIHAPLVVTDYSTGELSLFNIARAIILDSKVLFLDEMNAKIDSLSAKRIIEVIDEVSKNKLVMLINHYGDLLSGSKIINLEK